MDLSGNPFSVVSREELADMYVPLPAVEHTADTILRLPHQIVEIQAPAGYGKSTLLSALRRRLTDAEVTHRYHYLPIDQPNRLPELGAVNVLLLDEAQRLSRWNRRRVRRWLGGDTRMITGTHRPLRLRGIKATVIDLPELTVGHLHAVFQQRIKRRGGDPQRIRLEPAAARWLVQHLASLREIEGLLYEWFQLQDARAQWIVRQSELSSIAEGSM